MSAAEYLDELPERELLATIDVLYDWSTWARPDQREPAGDWFVWLVQSGRGWGKTRTAAEAVRARIDSGAWRVVNVAGPTWTDVWDTMVQGTDDAPGLARIWPPHQRPKIVRDEHNPHLECWNGALIRLRAAKQAERFRGPQADGGWADEIDSWKPDLMTASEAFALFELGIRLGDDPRILATSTPKPRGLVKELLARSDCAVTRGATYDNAENLSPRFLRMLRERYEGTRLGRQELYGEILDDTPGALWTRAMLERACAPVGLPELERVIVAIDPAATANAGSDETGIIAAGKGVDGRAYVLADRSCRLSPEGWATRAIATLHELAGDRLVAEANQGGDMVERVIRVVDPTVPLKLVRATRGKVTRAEPIAALYEQGRVSHARVFPELEEQLVAFTPEGYQGDGSPDRADALVWALSELMLGDWGFAALEHMLPELTDDDRRRLAQGDDDGVG